MLTTLFISPSRGLFSTATVLVLVVQPRDIHPPPSRITRSSLPRIHDMSPRLLTGWGMCPRRTRIRIPILGRVLVIILTPVTNRDTQGTRDTQVTTLVATQCRRWGHIHRLLSRILVVRLDRTRVLLLCRRTHRYRLPERGVRRPR